MSPKLRLQAFKGISAAAIARAIAEGMGPAFDSHNTFLRLRSPG
jgi:hypothetical protein